MSDNAPKISRELMGKIVDEVFDGAIEDCSVIEEIYAAIKRHEAEEHPATTVNLKPLDWEVHHQTHYANSLFGNYSIWKIGGSVYLRSPGDYGGKVVGSTIEEGKVAALRDIEERILTAIAHPPAPPPAPQVMGKDQ